MVFCRLGSLTFEYPDKVKYPSLDLVYAAGRAGGTMTGVLSAANEKAVEMFIDEKYVYYSLKITMAIFAFELVRFILLSWFFWFFFQPY